MHSQSSSRTDSVRTEPASLPVPSAHLAGSSVSAGIAIGRALLVGRRLPPFAEVELAPAEVDAEVSRFRQALIVSGEQLEQLRQRVAGAIGEEDAAIFDAHLMLVADQGLSREVIEQISSQRRNAEFAFQTVIERYSSALAAVDDNYIRDRLVDIQDVAARVIRNLQGHAAVDLSHLSEPCIVVARDLSPSETAGMDRQHVIGFVTCLGSRTSHTAIMARSMGIPAVAGVPDATTRIATGDLLILDGLRGQVVVSPTEEELRECDERIRAQLEWEKRIEAESKLPAETTDGFRVSLAANIELPEEVETVKQTYGVGIGLFRTEFLFVRQARLPDEEEQFECYRRVTEAISPQSVIFRTLDIGGDKFVSHLDTPTELNPFLGMRAIRFCLSRSDVFKSQLRAILRASAYGKVRIMFPMISTLDELLQALVVLDEARGELDERGIAYNHHLDVGTMIEVPSAAMLADQLAPHVDFFSLGTNDLIQYLLAADRSNPDIAHLYQPTHPSVIRLIRDVVRAAYAHGKWIGICGEMAADPIFLPLVLGLGIHELSLAPVAIGLVRSLVRRVCMYEAEGLVQQAAECGTATEVRGLCEEFMRRVAPDLVPGG